MTPYRKKLIEVALPLEAINVASAREKSIRHGHPSTLHLWWARRPLAACRAVLFASLVDDPSSDPMFGGDEEIEASKRAELFNLIEELVQWANSNNPRVINKARAEIVRCIASRKIETGELKKDQSIPIAKEGKGKASKKYTPHDIKHMLASPEAVDHFLASYGPPVLDPFCGGGSIPLEAQRLGLRAYGSDLNPVAVLITKALIEIPPKFAGMPPVNPEWQEKPQEEKAATVWQGAQGLAEDVRYYGNWMRDEAEKRLGHLYPKVKVTKEMARDRPDLKAYVGQELPVIAWLWARTVTSPNPATKGTHVPLVRSFWLCTKKGKEAWVEPLVDHQRGDYRFVVHTGQPPEDVDPRKGTVIRTGAKCLLSGIPIPFDFVREEGKAGRMGQRLMAVVAEAGKARIYLSPTDEHAQVAESVRAKNYPDTDLPSQALSIRVMLYGMDKHYKLFTPRQLTFLSTASDLVLEARGRVVEAAKAGLPFGQSNDLPLSEGGGGPCAYADAVATYLAEAVSKTAAFHCTLASWRAKEGKSARAFGRQSMPMVWDFAEVNPFYEGGGSLCELFDSAYKTIGALPAVASGHVEQLDAASARALEECVVSTDPPYYDNVNYAELSDFYYMWLRRSAQKIWPKLFSTLLVPKQQELIATPYRFGGSRQRAAAFFEEGLQRTFRNIRGINLQDVPVTVYYGFKQSENRRG